jgi:hypothetical protein
MLEEDTDLLSSSRKSRTFLSKKNVRYLIGAAIVVTMIAVTIGLSVGLSDRNKKHKDDGGQTQKLLYQFDDLFNSSFSPSQKIVQWRSSG